MTKLRRRSSHINTNPINIYSPRNQAALGKFFRENVIDNVTDMVECLFHDNSNYGNWDAWENIDGCEVAEAWLVTPFLGKLLLNAGEPIYARRGYWIWGCTTGIACCVDGVLAYIAAKLGLLR